MKKFVYQYLDSLFSRAEISSVDTEFGKVYKAVIGNNETLFRLQFQRRGHGLSIMFNHSEYVFIKHMFSLTDGDCVDYIREYLGDTIDPNLYDYPFHPYI